MDEVQEDVNGFLPAAIGHCARQVEASQAPEEANAWAQVAQTLSAAYAPFYRAQKQQEELARLHDAAKRLQLDGIT